MKGRVNEACKGNAQGWLGPPERDCTRSTNFSEAVLSANSSGLAVLCGGNLGWSDLGETHLVLSVLGRTRMGIEWVMDGLEEVRCAS